MKTSTNYCCTKIDCNHAQLSEHDDGLRCPNSHFFPYIPETKVPIFACDPENTTDYARIDAATIHDNSFRWVFETFGTDEKNLRKSLISRMHLSKGQTILVTGAGAGNDLPFLAENLQGSGALYAQDISKQMLMAGVDRYGTTLNESGIDVYFSASDAADLPFEKNFFDGAYHFGGLNLFPNIQKGISEMNRVVKPGGRIVICDEGLAPWLKETELGKMLIQNNPLYSYDAPLSLLPDTAKSVILSWELNHCFYVIEFTVSENSPGINLDVPHIGKRGGSIRTRYHGQLEGVNPTLRDKVYAAAEKKGVSRVEYLERLLEGGCS